MEIKKETAATPFDVCVLTAANESQAEGYRIQLQEHRRDALPIGELLVIADPHDRRIGSGGSTFYVLDQLYRRYGKRLFRMRVLILHSGGDSRRLPAYSAVGKLFTPLPAQRHETLFDIMIDTYARLPRLPQGQVIVASGDVLLNFDAAFVEFSERGITGVAYPEEPSAGRHFGVYVVAEAGLGPQPAKDVLQKPDTAELHASGAIDFAERIWVDTGILHLAPDAVRAFLNCRTLQDAFARGERNYNLYHEILYAVHGKLRLPDARKLSALTLHVNCLPYCGFYHVGRSEEFLNSFYTLTHASAHYRFCNTVRSNAGAFPQLKSAWVYNSAVASEDLHVRRPCLIEGCVIDDRLVAAGDNILSGLPPGCGPVELGPGVCLSLLPLDDGSWTAVIYGIRDSFKDDDASFLNRPLGSFMSEAGLSEAELWPDGGAKTVWNAVLFPCCPEPAAAASAALSLQKEPSEEWRNARRISMKEVLLHADRRRLLDHRRRIERRISALRLREALHADEMSYEQVRRLLQDEETCAVAEQRLRTIEGSALERARAEFWLGTWAAEKGDEVSAEKHMQEAFRAIREAVGEGLQNEHLLKPLQPIRSDEVVWVLLPARLDFAGGWTDTPPICLERGGCVLNASVTLNGQYPIQVVAKVRPDDYVLGVNSIDLGVRAAVSSMEELRRCDDPSDWLSLPKAACFAAGLVPADFDGSLRDLLQPFGGGIDLTLFSALPAGSGLGTSSILGAGIIAALARLSGRTMPRSEIYARTSNLEQLMTTGGGWQDQIGGVAGGVKLITTSPGYDQTPTLAWTTLAPTGIPIGERFLLYYTGGRRLAKNLLRQVVGRYLKREAEALRALDELAALAREMKEDLDHRRIDDFGRKIRRAWALNKTLDQGQTTKVVEAILRRIDDWMLGAKLLGAGGGGFLFIVAKDRRAAARIRAELEASPPNARARFFDFDVDEQGMRLSVL